MSKYLKIKDLSQLLLDAKNPEGDVLVYTVDVSPFNGSHELRDAGYAISAYYDEETGGLYLEGAMEDSDETEF